MRILFLCSVSRGKYICSVPREKYMYVVFLRKNIYICSVLFKTLEYFPSALFPKIWNSIELELKSKLNLQNCLKEKSSKTI